MLLLIDQTKRVLVYELDSTEKSIKESFEISTKIIVGGVVLLIVIVLILVNAVVATLKSRFRSERRLKDTVAKMEEINLLAAEKNKLLEGVSYINDHIQKSHSLETLSYNVIRSVVGYLEVPAGVIYIKDENGFVAEFNSNQSKIFYHNDHLGSTSVITNESGDVIEETFYDPYGAILEGGNASRYSYEGKDLYINSARVSADDEGVSQAGQVMGREFPNTSSDSLDRRFVGSVAQEEAVMLNA